MTKKEKSENETFSYFVLHTQFLILLSQILCPTCQIPLQWTHQKYGLEIRFAGKCVCGHSSSWSNDETFQNTRSRLVSEILTCTRLCGLPTSGEGPPLTGTWTL